MQQELLTAEMRLRDGNTGPTGAPQNVDEAWAIYMGVPEGTVRSDVFRARRALRPRLAMHQGGTE